MILPDTIATIVTDFQALEGRNNKKYISLPKEKEFHTTYIRSCRWTHLRMCKILRQGDNGQLRLRSGVGVALYCSRFCTTRRLLS